MKYMLYNENSPNDDDLENNELMENRLTKSRAHKKFALDADENDGEIEHEVNKKWLKNQIQDDYNN